MELRRTILRRSIVALCVLGTFLLWIWRPSSIGLTLAILGALVLASVLLGVLLSWPRSILLRAAIIFGLASIIGIGGDPDRLLIGVLTGLPLAFLALLIAGVDWLAAKAFKARPGSESRSA